MSIKSITIFLILLLILFPFVSTYSLTLGTNIIKGNKFYQEGKYEDAVRKYTEGLAKKANYTLYYNRGASFYKLGQYNKAISDFENAATYSNSEKGHIKAIYNAGNSSFMQAEADKAKNPSSALESYEKAVKHFERVLQLDSNNAEAAYNLELGRIRIDELKKKQKNDQKNKDHRKQDQQNQNQQQDQQNNNQQSQNQQQDQQNNNQQSQNQQQDQQNNNQQSQNQQQDQQDNNQQNTISSENVSPEDILKEEARRKETANLFLSNGSAEPVDKDW